MQSFTVSPKEDGQKLDRVILHAFPGLSYSKLRAALRKKDVRIDGQRVKAVAPVHAGQTIAVYLPDAELAPRPRADILFEDEAVLLAHKPQGLPVQSDKLGEDSLEARLRGSAEASFPAACHRLDVQTAGLVLFAKNPQSHAAALEAFRSQKIGKHYQCFTTRPPQAPRGELRHYLYKDAAGAHVRVAQHPGPNARQAILQYETLSCGDSGALLHVQLHTGRTHQIRVQLAQIGCPLLGDDRYGDRARNGALHLRTQALWACALHFAPALPAPLQALSGRWFYAPQKLWRYPPVEGLRMCPPEELKDLISTPN